MQARGAHGQGRRQAFVASKNRQQTAAKRQRERDVQERRALKQAKKEARRAKAAGVENPDAPLHETDGSPDAPPAAPGD